MAVSGCKIAISGDLGSGKTTVTRYLIEKYGFQTFSTGAYQRELAAKMGMSTLELNEYAETHPEIDRDIDGKLTEIGKMPGNIIFDSRMAWHFVENAFKVYIKCDLDIAASRIFYDRGRGHVESYGHHQHAKGYILNRRASEERRYWNKYGVMITDMSNYDFVIDASNRSIEETAEGIYSEMQKFFAIKA